MKFLQLITAILVTTLIAIGSPTALAQTVEVYQSFTDEELVSILKDGGYIASEITEEGAIQVKVNGRIYMLYNSSGDGDLVSYYGITGVDVDEQEINEWNRTRRLSRAYIDNDQDPILESDLLSDAGVSKSQVQEFFRIFVSSVDSFRTFVDNNDSHNNDNK